MKSSKLYDENNNNIKLCTQYIHLRENNNNKKLLKSYIFYEICCDIFST